MHSGPAVGVDVGGTFTDVVLLAEGSLTTVKVPTTADQSEGVLRGIERACEGAGIDVGDLEQFRHAMTVATNAMLERDGARTALVTTEGFRDVLAIARQDRPELYDPGVCRPTPLVPRERRYELDERATPAGIETPIDRVAIRELTEELPDDVESVAVSFLHAYAHPENERRVAEVLRERTEATVVTSHETLPTFREYERTATTVADAYVTPGIEAYLDTLIPAAREAGLGVPRIMQSNGGIASAETLRDGAVSTILSGPAAGVVGAALFDEGGDGVVSFDMGGTSCDVGLVREGAVERRTDATVGDHPIHVPMVDVETVGAGGGSVAWVDDGGALRVGPRSAGANPGPVCYGRGGTEPTVTDAALTLGYLDPDTALGGAVELTPEPATDALKDLAVEAGLADALAAAAGVYRVATTTMTGAVRRVTVERGHDPRSFTLVAFGGAGPVHAASLADALDIGRVLVPRANGVLSALGLLAADERHDAVRTHRTSLSTADREAIDGTLADLEATVLADTTEPERASLERTARLRYAGQRHELTVDLGDEFDPESMAKSFHATHERVRGYRLPDEPVELVDLSVAATILGSAPPLDHDGDRAEPVGVRDGWFDGRMHETPVFERTGLAPGFERTGPAIVEGGESTVVVPPDWAVELDGRGTLHLEGSS